MVYIKLYYTLILQKPQQQQYPDKTFAFKVYMRGRRTPLCLLSARTPLYAKIWSSLLFGGNNEFWQYYDAMNLK